MEDTQNSEEIEMIEAIFPEGIDALYPDDVAPMELAEEDSLEPLNEDNFALDLDYFDPELQEDKLWQARTGLDEESLKGAIETIIFISDKPVSLERVRKLIDEDLPLRVVHEALESLMESFEIPGHGIRLVEVAEGYQYRTKATYSKYVQDLFKVNSLVLTPTALEVLAILAYKQPCSKIEVDKIRGVDSGHIVRGLMDKRLVKVAGRSDEMGRPVLYGTTPEFLEVFNLADLSHLPPEHEVEEMSKIKVSKMSDIKNIVQDGDKERFKFEEMEELEELSESIKSIASDTDFIKSLNAQDKLKKKAEDGTEPRSAFDLLEEYVNNQIIIVENKASIESELMTAVTDPQVISDLTAGPFNLPEVDDEFLEEEFEMIDLDTGEPIRDEEVLGIDLLKGESEDEEAELSAALDEAFERLTGEKLEEVDEILKEELGLGQQKVEDKEDELEAKTADIIDKADELDIDLSFLGEDLSGPDTKEEEQN
jgi:segregation and condensation protein B